MSKKKGGAKSRDLALSTTKTKNTWDFESTSQMYTMSPALEDNIVVSAPSTTPTTNESRESSETMEYTTAHALIAACYLDPYQVTPKNKDATPPGTRSHTPPYSHRRRYKLMQTLCESLVADDETVALYFSFTPGDHIYVAVNAENDINGVVTQLEKLMALIQQMAFDHTDNDYTPQALSLMAFAECIFTYGARKLTRRFEKILYAVENGGFAQHEIGIAGALGAWNQPTRNEQQTRWTPDELQNMAMALSRLVGSEKVSDMVTDDRVRNWVEKTVRLYRLGPSFATAMKKPHYRAVFQRLSSTCIHARESQIARTNKFLTRPAWQDTLARAYDQGTTVCPMSINGIPLYVVEYMSHCTTKTRISNTHDAHVDRILRHLDNADTDDEDTMTVGVHAELTLLQLLVDCGVVTLERNDGQRLYSRVLSSTEHTLYISKCCCYMCFHYMCDFNRLYGTRVAVKGNNGKMRGDWEFPGIRETASEHDDATDQEARRVLPDLFRILQEQIAAVAPVSEIFF